MSVIIHFETLPDRLQFINSCIATNRLNTFSSSFSRCLCCYQPEPQHLFEDSLVLLDNEKIGRPDDIYWQNFDYTFAGRFFRVVLGIIILAVGIIITSTIVAVCLLYVSGQASCNNYNSNTTMAQALGDKTLLYCFCQDNILSSDPMIKANCKSIDATILLSNGLMVVASVASSLTNIILGFLVGIVVKFMKPITKSYEYNINFVTILLATLINACFLPLFLNANVFGYTPSTYMRIFNFINFTNI